MDSRTLPTDPPAEGVMSYLGLDGCIRLPIRLDAARLASEFERLPDEVWGGADRGPVVFASVASFFIVGHPRGASIQDSEDRPVLGQLPYLREIVREMIPVAPCRAKVARQPPNSLLPIHADDARFFNRTVRLSLQADAEGPQRLYCDGLWYDLAPGEVWALNNLRPHGIRNAGARGRISVLVDYPPTDQLLELMHSGDHGLGVTDAAATLALENSSREQYRKYRWQGIVYGFVKRWQRKGGR